MFERGPLTFVINWSPFSSYEGYRVAVPCPGKWRVALNSDALEFGGLGRVRSQEPMGVGSRDGTIEGGVLSFAAQLMYVGLKTT